MPVSHKLAASLSSSWWMKSLVCTFRNALWCHFLPSPISLWWMLTLEHHLPTDCPSTSTQTLCSDQNRRGLDVIYMGVWGLITQAWQSEFNPQSKVKCQIWWCISVNICNVPPTATWEAETGESARSLWATLEHTLQQRKQGTLCQQGRSCPRTSTSVIRD